MREYRADVHVHTVLSPCGDVEMSPGNIVHEAALKNIDILGITDHNSTLHAPLVKRLAEQKGIFVLCGAEVTTKEEIHCLAFFENFERLNEFQHYLEANIIRVKFNPGAYGYQLVVDEYEQVLKEIDTWLVSALDQTIDQVEREVHRLNGLFIPAHIDRPAYGLISQLGFIPPDLPVDALEIQSDQAKARLIKQFPDLEAYTFICSSDAHYPGQIGQRTTTFSIKSACFEEIRLALKGINGRSVKYNTGHS